MARPEVKIRVNTQETGQTGALSGVRDRLKEIAGAVPGVSSTLGTLASVSAGVAAAISGAAAAVRAFAAQETEIAKLDAALAGVGKLTDDNRAKMQELASSLQNATSIADDEWLRVLTRLVQFGADPANLGMDAEAVKNLAGVVGSVTTATDLYTKALAGNFSALGRYGIRAKSIAELQQEAKKGAGQLEAQAGSLSGRFQNLSNVFGDFGEAVGQNIAEMTHLGDVLDFIAGGFEWWAEKLGSTVQVLEGVHNKTAQAASSTSDYADELKRVSEFAEQVAKSTDMATAAIRGQQSAQDEIADAKMALDLAQIDEQERSGKLNHQKALAARYKVRRDAANAKFARAQAADTAVMQSNEDALQQLVAQRSALAPKIAQAAAAAAKNARTDSDREKAAALVAHGARLMAWKPGVLDWAAGPQVAMARMAERHAEGVGMYGAGTSAARRFDEIRRERGANLEAITSTAADLDQQIAARHAATLSGNTEIAQRMATRATVHELNQQTASGMQQSLGAVQQTSQLMIQIAQQFLQIQQQTEARLRQIASQSKSNMNP